MNIFADNFTVYSEEISFNSLDELNKFVSSIENDRYSKYEIDSVDRKALIVWVDITNF